MITPRDRRPVDLEPEDEPSPTPIWKRKGVLLFALGALVLVVFIFMHSGARIPPPIDATQGSTIAVAQPYEGLKDKPPTPLLPPPLPIIPAPPPPPSLPELPGQPRNTARPAMMSFPVHVEAPKEVKGPAEPDKTGLKFATATLPGVKASPAIDDTYMLMPGLMTIVLDSAIDSNLPGPILGHLPTPVYSRKGVVLLEAMTQVVGRYESLKQNGVERLEASSLYAFSPNGIWVPLTGQPLADGLGRAGLSATIDHRYIERFGGAVLLDLSQTGLQIIQSEVSKGGSTYLNFNGSDQLANQILQSTINLPPIATKNQGSMIAIVLTEPISFEDSYRVHAAR